MLTINRCSCGRFHFGIPKHARVSNDPHFGGAYWECSCKSSLFVRTSKNRASRKLRAIFLLAFAISLQACGQMGAGQTSRPTLGLTVQSGSTACNSLRNRTSSSSEMAFEGETSNQSYQTLIVAGLSIYTWSAGIQTEYLSGSIKVHPSGDPLATPVCILTVANGVLTAVE